MATKKTTRKRVQSAPEASADFDNVLKRMLETPPSPKSKSHDKKAGPAVASPAKKPSTKKR